ncbi:uncharacterized protein KY384_000963 [Bacidia gigantensis]|uniref:uncharacterized protein n=1 Tax=Bacidia gigantensis TaxID=2732470 RepID=UPI001D03C416|nr:uncharacterized protein KY384_000963 [Bacidia gigantensis]KAG8534119.1 hypothetical protein KY384_000963 [Bacidia gigantensis]
MAPKRRNGTAAINKDTPSSSVNTPTSASITNPLRPTPLETLLLAIYPALLLLGAAFSLFDPSARTAPYNNLTQSHPPDLAPSYFALKRNFLNSYFVKIHWFWVSLAYIVFLFTSRASGPPGGLVVTPKRLRGAVRYALVTAWWLGVTQWFFGPALVDRGFRVSGGACEIARRLEGKGGVGEVFSKEACRAVGGVWRGGHDISGHVFILTMGSAFLAMEMLPVVLGWKGLRDERVARGQRGEVGRVDRGSSGGDVGEEGEQETAVERVGAWLMMGVVGLSWYMLLMTAIYFHTWFEKHSLPSSFYLEPFRQ